ncbi:hypothetical protein EXN66_Car003776 [Channa argus]|uniref:Uncharacterized protein n=1 Tax=Channa argus TaxID=215402 RepID=A0A6G1PDA2_CHAAH|nr:hypothetical protein EXN66_Car003776 [Channa argus]
MPTFHCINNSCVLSCTTAHRLYLAALRYDGNASRPQATSIDGEPLFKVKVPKGRKSQCVARAVKTQPAYGYVDNLMEMILDKVVLDPAPYTDELLSLPVPPPLCADFDRPHKEDAVTAVVSAWLLSATGHSEQMHRTTPAAAYKASKRRYR